ncbi:protein-L-isoaspartate O-methyltransferase family protein [Comamonas composti]|uniref:protein-L-isoaspartate O-methyltransferase family protein n=1 Tax=Comamonas composti TaxID=408558 RepID=UPI00040EFD15|nr:protein-L-isoaspartate O-methyltransferase [Comamonas composti]
MPLPLNSSAHLHDTNAQARYHMIEQQIRPWNVLDEQVLELLDQVRREDFVPPEHASLAFMDLEIPLQGTPDEAVDKGWCMLAPRVEARMLQDLQLKSTDRVLEIGAGSGHMAALLAAMAKEVVSLEIEPELAEMARENLLGAGVENVRVIQADGADSASVQDVAPEQFDAIVLSGSVAQVPQFLIDKLADGGRLGAIVGQLPVMCFTLLTKNGQQVQTLQPWDLVAARLANFDEPSRFNF